MAVTDTRHSSSSQPSLRVRYHLNHTLLIPQYTTTNVTIETIENGTTTNNNNNRTTVHPHDQIQKATTTTIITMAESTRQASRTRRADGGTVHEGTVRRSVGILRFVGERSVSLSSLGAVCPERIVGFGFLLSSHREW